MNDLAVRTVGLGKMYTIGAEQERYRTLRDSVMHAVRRPIERIRHPGAATHKSDVLWALKDVNLELRHGEALGVIGRNGSGKSTLLKVLSHITHPTAGRVEIRGRVASLLEVGTGFHAELTGRENIQLNGAILGMTRAEIRRRFDEIVEFSEIGRFLDTPVKRYSSGMYVRLAFAVAAHLDPEILIVDEVLAVGDAEFQKKCLGRMSEVASGGRTVIFVSHNMSAVNRLCSSALLLDAGRVKSVGQVHEITSRYLQSDGQSAAEREWPDLDTSPGDGTARLNHVRVLQHGEVTGNVDISEPISLEMTYTCLKEHAHLLPAFSLLNDEGQIVFVTADFAQAAQGKHHVGRYRATCEIPADLLSEGTLYVAAEVNTSHPTYEIHVLERNAASFHVSESEGGRGVRAGWGRSIPGVVRPRLDWTRQKVSAESDDAV